MPEIVALIDTDYYEATRGYWIHRLFFQLETDAEEADLYLEILDQTGDINLIEESYIGFDIDSNNHELTFKTWEKISDSVRYDILENASYLSYNFNEEGY